MEEGTGALVCLDDCLQYWLRFWIFLTISTEYLSMGCHPTLSGVTFYPGRGDANLNIFGRRQTDEGIHYPKCSWEDKKKIINVAILESVLSGRVFEGSENSLRTFSRRARPEELYHKICSDSDLFRDSRWEGSTVDMNSIVSDPEVRYFCSGYKVVTVHL